MTVDPVAAARQHSLADVLRRTARRHPDKLAVVATGRRASFAEFDAAVNRCANSLAHLGLRKGDRLGLFSHNCWQFCVLSFASARLGIVLVPINFMLNADEVAYIAADSELQAMVAEDALVATAASALAQVGREDLVRGRIEIDPGAASPRDGWHDVDSWIDGPDASEPTVAVADDDPIRLMYTSGTESRPKGVLLSSRCLISQYVSCVIDGGMGADDIELHTLPLYHCAQLDCFFGVDIYLGATSIVAPAPDPATMLATIEREGVTKLFCPPTVWIALLAHPDFERRDLTSLTKGYYGASPMPVEVLAEIRRRLPNVRLWNFYGQTEMSPVATILPPEEQEARAGSAGRAALNVETRVVDERGDDVPAGTVGEIVHRSPQATLGYHRLPEKTADAFRGGWFHSGDLGMFDDDGYLTVVDRVKDMIKTGGENVASREVEEALYALDGVSEVAVVGIPHPHWVEAVAAVVVRSAGSEIGETDIAEHARRLLAGYKRPKEIVFVDRLPKNPSGKILKRELRQLFTTRGTR